jgi:ribonuclease T2
MIPLAPLILLSAVIAPASRADTCPQITSCSPEAQGADSCCVPNPGGLFVFRQRFEPDVDGDLGRWGIDGLEVLK